MRFQQYTRRNFPRYRLSIRRHRCIHTTAFTFLQERV
jgi:hypothetical protein